MFRMGRAYLRETRALAVDNEGNECLIGLTFEETAFSSTSLTQRQMETFPRDETLRDTSPFRSGVSSSACPSRKRNRANAQTALVAVRWQPP